MPLPADSHLMKFHRTGALATPASQVANAGPVDVNDSLGGFRAAQRASLESTLTSAMTQLGTIVDSTQVQAVPAGPVVFTTPLENSGSYLSAASLVHWYRPSLNPDVNGDTSVSMHYGMGTDYGLVPVHLAIGRPGTGGSTGLKITDVDVAEQPGHFDVQRGSVHFNSGGIADNQALVNTANSTMSLANAWTILAHVRTTTIAAGIATVLHVRLAASATDLSINSIRMRRDAADLQVAIVDTATLGNTKNYVYTGFFAANTWYGITMRWDGTTLSVFKDGVFLAPSSMTDDDAVTMIDSSRRFLISGANNSSTNPTEEWLGQIHSILAWSTVLTDVEVAAADALGDGVGRPYSHVGDWLVFVSGTVANRMEARKIVFHNTLTGEMHLEQPLPALGAIGDVYRIGKSDLLFDDGPTAGECSTGLVDHRCIAFHNLTGEQLTDVRFYLIRLDPRSTSYEIAVSDTTIGSTALPSILNDETDPDIKNGLGANGFSTSLQTFRRAQDFVSGRGSPSGASGAAVNLASQTEIGLWIRRTIEPLTRIGKSAWLLVAEAASGVSSGVGPFYSATVLLTEPVGFVPEFTVTFDRTPRTFGGARVTAHIEDSVTDTPVESIPVTIELTTGPGSLETAEAQPIYTDADGDAAAQYIGPNDEGDVGATVVVTAHYIGD